MADPRWIAWAILFGTLAGCATTEPPTPPGPPPPEPVFPYRFPSAGANATYVHALPPTATDGLDRIYLGGGRIESEDLVVLDAGTGALAYGDAAGEDTAAAVARVDGVATILLESDAGVSVLQERNATFQRLPSIPAYRVGNAALADGHAYLLLLDPEFLGAHRLLRVAGDGLADVPLDPTIDRGINGPTLGSDGATLSLCQRRVPDHAVQAVVLDPEGRLLETHVLDPIGVLASRCVAAQAWGLHAFAWQASDTRTFVAYLRDGQLETHAVGDGLSPTGLWAAPGSAFLLARDLDNMVHLLTHEGAQWDRCQVSADPRDHVTIHHDGTTAWLVRLAYSDPSPRLEREPLPRRPCGTLT